MTPGRAPGGAVPAADHLDVVYTSRPRALRLDLYVPAGAPPFPLIMWLHGGEWRQGDKRLRPGHPALRQRERGYAVAAVEYRLSGEALFPAQVHDAKAALRFLRAHAAAYGLDPRHVAAWGASAGGHLATLLGTSAGVGDLEDHAQGHADQPGDVQAVVDWYGPTDFLEMEPSHDAADSPESQLLGAPLRTCPERARLANPITYASARTPPFFIQHGTADALVEPRQSERLHAALRAAGAVSSYVPLAGAGHGGVAFVTAENVARVERFLDAHLRPAR